MRKVSLSLLFLFFSMITHAYDVEIDGIYYNLLKKSKEAEVTYEGKNNRMYSYTNDVIIPESIEYEGTPYKVSSIGDYAFFWCNVISVKMPNSIKSIGKWAFYRCERLSSMEISKSDTTIGEHAFGYCTRLTSISIPNSVTFLGDNAFSNCTGLSSINIPNSVTYIGSSAFSNCTGLPSISIPNSVTYIGGGAFTNCTGLSSISIPNSVTYIGSNAFSNCTGLSSIRIPNSLTSIESSTFEGCMHIIEVIIPKSIKTIKESAFANCKSLEKVYCYVEHKWDEKQDWTDDNHYVSSNSFDGSQIEYTTLYVPESFIENYITTKPWCDFGNIIAIKEGDISEEKCSKPEIYYNNGKLSFKSETVGADFIYEITNADIKKGYESVVNLNVTYNISVYALKPGYENSEVTNATLCWIDIEPKTEGITSAATSISARPILIQNNGGDLLIKGAGDELITIYDLSGKKVGEGKSKDDNIVINTNLKKGNIAILKVGERSIKILMR